MLHTLQNARNLTPQQQSVLQQLTHQYKLMQQHQQMTRLQQQSPMGVRPVQHATDRPISSSAMVATQNFANERTFNSQQPLSNNQPDGLQKQFKTEGNFNLESCQDISKLNVTLLKLTLDF